MLKAIISNELAVPLTSPPEIESDASIFTPTSQTKLEYLKRLLKWLLTQNIEENLESKLYQDTLSTAIELKNSIQSKNLPQPQKPDIDF